MRLAVPSYFYPGAEWDRLLQHKPSVVVVNPASGPGQRIDQNYATLVRRLQAADIRTLGYIATDWARAYPEKVASEQAKYRKWYKVSDFFFDEGATSAENVRYYEPMVETSILPALNPGTFPSERYMRLKRAIHMIYECGLQRYLAEGPPTWTAKYPRGKFWHCVFGVPTLEEAIEVAKVAKGRKAGYIYITDDEMLDDDNPYDRLPSYWEGLVRGIKRL